MPSTHLTATTDLTVVVDQQELLNVRLDVRLQHLLGVDVPDEHLARFDADDVPPVAGAHRAADDRTVLAVSERPHQATVFEVPDSDGAARRRHRPTLAGDGDAFDGAIETIDGVDVLVDIVEVPDLDRLVDGGGDELVARRTASGDGAQRNDPAEVRVQRLDEVADRRVPDVENVANGGNDELAFLREDDERPRTVLTVTVRGLATEIRDHKYVFQNVKINHRIIT